MAAAADPEQSMRYAPVAYGGNPNAAPYPRAPWKMSGWLYLVSILGQREVGGRKQCRVSWSGYPAWKPVWIDEDKLVSAAASERDETHTRSHLQRASELEQCPLPCAGALVRKRKRACPPPVDSLSELSRLEVTQGERHRKRQQRSAVPKGAVMEVERLLASRRTSRLPSAQRTYLVRWKGFDYREDCWEPQANIEASLVDQFEECALPRVELTARAEVRLADGSSHSASSA